MICPAFGASYVNSQATKNKRHTVRTYLRRDIVLSPWETLSWPELNDRRNDGHFGEGKTTARSPSLLPVSGERNPPTPSSTSLDGQLRGPITLARIIRSNKMRYVSCQNFGSYNCENTCTREGDAALGVAFKKPPLKSFFRNFGLVIISLFCETSFKKLQGLSAMC